MKTFNTYIEMKQYIADTYYTGKNKSSRSQVFFVTKDNREYRYFPKRDLVVHN